MSQAGALTQLQGSGQGCPDANPRSWWPSSRLTVGAGFATLTCRPRAGSLGQKVSSESAQSTAACGFSSRALRPRHCLRRVFLEGAMPSFPGTPSLCLGTAPAPQSRHHVRVGMAAPGTQGPGSAWGDGLRAAVSTGGLGSAGPVERGQGGGFWGGEGKGRTAPLSVLHSTPPTPPPSWTHVRSSSQRWTLGVEGWRGLDQNSSSRGFHSGGILALL